MFPYISFNYSQYILLLAVAIIFYNNSLNIIGKKKRVYPYIIQLIVTIAVPLLTYQAQKMLSIYSYPVMPYVIFSLIIYVLLIIVLKSFASIRNGMFNIRDIIILALTLITVCAVFTVTNAAYIRQPADSSFIVHTDISYIRTGFVTIYGKQQ